ncbi:hypothetical protein, partial [Clostridium sp. ZBS15]
IIFGGILLSLELYCLKFIQLFESMAFGSCYTNAWEYIKTVPILLALIITITIIAYGVILINKSKTEI